MIESTSPSDAQSACRGITSQPQKGHGFSVVWETGSVMVQILHLDRLQLDLDLPRTSARLTWPKICVIPLEARSDDSAIAAAARAIDVHRRLGNALAVFHTGLG
jgi:hypothetical protein